MPIRDRLSRIIRKSASSGSSGGGSSSDGHTDAYENTSHTPATTFPTPMDLRSYQTAHARFAKKTHWLSNPSSTSHDGGRLFSRAIRKSSSKRPGKSGPQRTHPSERELTEQNLHHQEILGMFTMKFGRSRRLSRGGRSHLSDISPCNSRVASVDLCRNAGPEDEEDEQEEVGQFGQRRMSSLTIGGPVEQGGTAAEDS